VKLILCGIEDIYLPDLCRGRCFQGLALASKEDFIKLHQTL
jgi:hypothetical protein